VGGLPAIFHHDFLSGIQDTIRALAAAQILEERKAAKRKPPPDPKPYRRGLHNRLYGAAQDAVDDFCSQGGSFDRAEFAILAADRKIRGKSDPIRARYSSSGSILEGVKEALTQFVDAGGNPNKRILVFVGAVQRRDEERCGTSRFIYIRPQDYRALT
jgi:hypothetical protein